MRLHGELQDRYDAVDGPGAAKAERDLASAIDVFNTHLDSTIEHGKQILPQLLKLSGEKERPPTPGELRDYAREVDEFLSEREARIRGLLNLGKSSPPEPPAG